MFKGRLRHRGEMAERKPVRSANTRQMRTFKVPRRLFAAQGPKALSLQPRQAPQRPHHGLEGAAGASAQGTFIFTRTQPPSDKSRSEPLHLLPDKEKREETLGVSRMIHLLKLQEQRGEISGKPAHPPLSTLVGIKPRGTLGLRFFTSPITGAAEAPCSCIS